MGTDPALTGLSQANLSLINLSIALAGIFLCLLGIFQVRMIFRSNPRVSRYFTLFFASLLVFAMSNMVGQLFRGLPGAASRVILIVSNYLEMTVSCLLTYIAARYYLSLMDPDKNRKALRISFAGMFLAHVLLVTVSQFSGFLYVIDESNVYHRSAGYPLAYLMPAAIMLLNAVLLSREHGRLSRKERFAFWVFILFPITAMIIQLFIYGVYIVVFASILTGLFLYMFIISDQEEKLEQQTKELSDLKMNILTEQIQPHFIYNTMNTAYLLTQKDPEQARTLIRDFMTYLKMNISALSASEPVSFTDELYCTKAYADILVGRFSGRFSVEYDLDFMDFELPPLSLQPIVENAIKHGVLMSDKPNRSILIRSRKEGDSAVVSVIDNGPGFDVRSAPSGESTHIGMGNVRERLQYMCRGSLEVSSIPGEGTTVTIRLPLE